MLEYSFPTEMHYKNKTNYVSNGIMTYIAAMINEHHADEQAIYTKVKALCNQQLNLIEGNDPERNQ